jgi:Na+-driven multidrug efflux pump
VGIALVAMLILMLCASAYSASFIQDEKIVAMATSGLLVTMLSFPFAGINTMVIMFFTAIGCAKEAAVISTARGLVIILIAIYTLPMLFGITGLWAVSPVMEVSTLLIVLYYLVRFKQSMHNRPQQD